ncbi:MAG: hypothetical protein KGN34_17270 [Sphingomonadales bacterium]|nr:hypothetical protein [Sphingomonadales bacterium]
MMEMPVWKRGCPGMNRLGLTAVPVFTQVPAVFALTVRLAHRARDVSHAPGSGMLARMVSGVPGPAMAPGAPPGGKASASQ